METRKVRLTITLYGKAPAKYGPNAYKAGLGDSLLFERAGWECVGSGQHYRYVRCPTGKVGREAEVEIQVPTNAEIERMAMAMHATRQNQTDGALGLVAFYAPAGGVTSTLSYPGTNEPDHVFRRQHAEFEIGYSPTWNVKLIWENGDDALPTWYRSENPIIDD